MFSREGYQSQILASLTAFSICSRKAVRLARLVDWDSSIIGNCRQQAGYIVSGHRVRSARQVIIHLDNKNIIKSAAFFTFGTPARVLALGRGSEFSQLFGPPSDWPKKNQIT